MKESAAKDSSTLTNPAESPKEGRRNNYLQMKLRELREENQRLQTQLDAHLSDPELTSLNLQNETLKAIIEGHLFKERLHEIVRIVLFTELDDFLHNRFTKGQKHLDEQVAKAKAALATSSTNKPENNDGR